ncbi:hypothetical protein Tco_0529527 [Tanacetum coccineum]
MEIPKPKAKKTVNVEIQDLNSPRPIPSKLPYPERMKVRENDKPSAQHSRFLKMFKQLRLEIGLKDALVEMPKFNKWLSSLLRNKENSKKTPCLQSLMPKVPLSSLNKSSREVSSPVRLVNNFGEVRGGAGGDELAPLDSLPTRLSVLLQKTILIEIDAFLAMEASSNLEEASRGDFRYMNQNKMNPQLLFLQGVILFTMSSPISTSQSQENVHANQSSVIESLPVSPIPVEDSPSPIDPTISEDSRVRSLKEKKLIQVIKIQTDHNVADLLTRAFDVSRFNFLIDSIGTDKTKITRKPSKMGKHGHEKRKSTREAKDSKPKPRKVNPWSILKTQGVSITDCHAGNPCELPSDLTANNDLPIIEELYGQDQKERGKQVRA